MHSKKHMKHLKNFFYKNFAIKQAGKFLGAMLLAISTSLGQSAKAGIMEDMSLGYKLDYFPFMNIQSGFIGYKFNPFIGINVGLGYGSEILVCVPSEIELLNLKETAKKVFNDKIQASQFDFLDQNEIRTLSGMLDGVQGSSTNQDINDLLTKANKKVKDMRDKSFVKLDQTIKNTLDGAWGIYRVEFLSIPLKFQVFPFGGTFAINLGIRVDYLLGVGQISMSGLVDEIKGIADKYVSDKEIDGFTDRYSQKLKNKKNEFISSQPTGDASAVVKMNRELKNLQDNLENEIDSKRNKIQGEVDTAANALKNIFNIEGIEDANDLDKELKNRQKDGASVSDQFNRWRISGIFGLEKTFFFGVLIGIEGTWHLTNFIKFEESKSKMLLPGMVRFALGFDIAKVIDLCMG